MTQSNVNRYRIAFCYGILLIALIPFPACFHSTSDSPTMFDATINTSDDIDQLKQIETQLTVTPEKAALHPDYQIVNDIAVPFVPEYRMGPGDVLEIVYHIKYEKTPQDYRMEIQDRLSVHFPYHPQFSSSVLVRTDGKITLPLIGDMLAEAKTPTELAMILNQEYKKYLINPSITVSLEEFNVKIAELKKAITTAPRGQSKIAPVAPDGRIAFPLIGSLQAQGFTLSQLEKIVNENYGKQVRNLNATLILLEIHHPKLYVLGEVEKPGAYDIASVPNVLNALTISGGFKKSGMLEEIAVFRNEGLERPIAFTVDIKTAMQTGNALTNVKLKPGDIIYVPKTRIDDINDIVERVFTKGIYAVLPFQAIFSANYDFNSQNYRP
jgi:polysaccharide export outer membrane protein